VLGAVCAALFISSHPVRAAREDHAVSYPAISADGKTVYFTTWGDIWSAPVDGHEPARRLTDNVAYEGRAIPSPDGKQLVFLSDRYGSYDLFTMPASGGEWTRLTWSMATDYDYDWKEDGSAVLAYTMRQDLWGEALYEIPLDGGNPRRITGPGDMDECVFGSYLGPSGDKFVYARGPGDWARLRHHGTDCYDIYEFDTATGKHTQLTDYDGNDMWPQSSPDGKTVYFVSDRDGARNIYAMALPSRKLTQLTHLTGPGATWPRLSPDGDQLVFTVDGRLFVLDVAGGDPRQVPVSFADGSKKEMVIDTDLPGSVDEYALSPNGKYFALDVYGDIYLLKNPDAYPPDAKPDQDLSLARKLVATPGREMELAWGPDSDKLTYISDRTGDFEVYVLDLKTLQEQQITHNPGVDDWLPKFAPQGNKLAYYKGNNHLMTYDLDSQQEAQVADGLLTEGPQQLGYSWSPDGQWIAYSRATIDYYTELFLVHVADGKSYDVSANAGYNVSTDWSPDGKWLAYTDYGEESASVTLLELSPQPGKYDTKLLFDEDSKSAPAPPAPQPAPTPEPGPTPKPQGKLRPAAAAAHGRPGAQAEPYTGEDEDEDAAAAPPPGAPAKPGGDQPDEAKKKVQVVIDTHRIELRGKSITGAAGNAESPKFDPTSKFLIFEMAPADTLDQDEPPTTWWSVSVDDKDRQFSQLTQQPGLTDPQFAPDGSKLYLRGSKDKTLSFVALNGPAAVAGGPLPTVSPVHLDQYAIWDQMLCEGWRHLRDTFYKSPKELGVDWDDVLARYRPRVQDCGTDSEFNDLYREMLGELGGSHLGFYGGSPTSEAPPETTADFGVWFDESFSGPGWKVAKVFHDGPADKPGSRLYPGDVILSLDGKVITAGSKTSRLLRNLAGKPVTLKVHSGPAALDALQADAAPGAPAPPADREIVILPTTWAAAHQLVYQQWTEDNRATVDKLSGGKVGYLHIQEMDQAALRKFRRELFTTNIDKPALIIDVRDNPGGNISEQLVNILDKRSFAIETHRGGKPAVQPALAYHGKIAVLINPHSYSDGEIFPHIMQELHLAKLVGEATGGNVIGTYDFPLLDGSMLRLPSWDWSLLDGTDMEGHGAQPDVTAIFDPEQAAQGKDNQLDAAVNTLLQELGTK
jgi:Tol biopolymer transport system component/C-terminal processing protease CtpA/Prc